jgi:hypothetical protein
MYNTSMKTLSLRMGPEGCVTISVLIEGFLAYYTIISFKSFSFQSPFASVLPKLRVQFALHSPHPFCSGVGCR